MDSQSQRFTLFKYVSTLQTLSPTLMPMYCFLWSSFIYSKKKKKKKKVSHAHRDASHIPGAQYEQWTPQNHLPWAGLGAGFQRVQD